MTDLIETRLNDIPFSATSCSWLFAGAPFVGITAVDFEDKRERKLVHASRKDGTPIGLTNGKYLPGQVVVTMLRSSSQRLLELLTPLGFGSYGDARFPFIAKYQEILAPVPPVIVMVAGCRIAGVKETFAEGSDELLSVVTMDCLTITRNGLALYSRVNGLGI